MSQSGQFCKVVIFCKRAALLPPPPHTAAMAKRKREVKSVNLQYTTLVRWDDGPNESLTKRLMFQALFFFHHFLDLGHSKRILQRILQEMMKKENTGSIRRLVDDSFGPSSQQTSVIYIVD